MPTASLEEVTWNLEHLVDDEGPGVPEQERDRVFSRFFRGGGEEVVRTRGAGLGLSIVTEFAASMGGEVGTGVAPTGGARFEVVYPRHDPGGPGDPGDPGDAAEPDEPGEPGELVTGPDPRRPEPRRTPARVSEQGDPVDHA